MTDNGEVRGILGDAFDGRPAERVFVDMTGRKRRRLRRAGYAGGVVCAAYVGLVGASLTGVDPPRALFPAPGLPNQLVKPPLPGKTQGPGPYDDDMTGRSGDGLDPDRFVALTEAGTGLTESAGMSTSPAQDTDWWGHAGGSAAAAGDASSGGSPGDGGSPGGSGNGGGSPGNDCPDPGTDGGSSGDKEGVSGSLDGGKVADAKVSVGGDDGKVADVEASVGGGKVADAKVSAGGGKVAKAKVSVGGDDGKVADAKVSAGGGKVAKAKVSVGGDGGEVADVKASVGGKKGADAKVSVGGKKGADAKVSVAGTKVVEVKASKGSKVKLSLLGAQQSDET